MFGPWQNRVQIKKVHVAEAMSVVEGNVGWDPAMEKCLGQEGPASVMFTLPLTFWSVRSSSEREKRDCVGSCYSQYVYQ